MMDYLCTRDNSRGSSSFLGLMKVENQYRVRKKIKTLKKKDFVFKISLDKAA
jgi:hypothetical protein